ncbi:RagB/SusD family nutrient uptake outer membrane protein [Hymenobacter cellulosilyticus]|uniref:RagB/SusD family nutrient uptake outer membrane protein n=1 Tax=Hymenobacter cellulosilyticus TaxID=2932248 RepID=A0A8T9Q4U0_9BACT|nr:RagB/SusD family nutrient uptake outer membrane protein [Hymenobacter cellulosilyticus]UOQ72085.1 RagB/SusD family nutrient uptake outer membrane protein [Hymenobacter cellulosilyticus]
MKNFINSFPKACLATLAFTATLGLSSCDKEVTDLRPQNTLIEADAFTNPARIALAVTGVYNAAQSGYYDPLNGQALAVRGYPFGAAANALDDARGEDVSDMAGFFNLVFANSINPSSPNVVAMWSNLYSVINQANVTIEGVRKAAANGLITPQLAADYEAEMRFLRALSHHELVIHFSRPYSDGKGSQMGVPYRETAINTLEALDLAKTVGRGTVAEDYTKMLADLDFAEANLPATRAGSLRVSRATKGAAIALKQRLRLHQGEWAEAVKEGDKLITGNTTFRYTLAATPRAAFPGGIVQTSENIFSIENSADDNAGTNGALANVYGASATPANGGINGRSLLAVSPILYNAPFFTCADTRRTELMQKDGVRIVYVTRKYTDAATSSDFAPLIRYAEVLLNQAEALSRLGGANEVQALTYLNSVRNRAVATADRYAVGSLTGSALTQAILNERRIEFVGEGMRWDDIHRLSGEKSIFSPVPGGGIPAKIDGNAGQLTSFDFYTCGGTFPTPAVAPVAYGSNLFVWPIPASELVTNPGLTPNPGY